MKILIIMFLVSTAFLLSACEEDNGCGIKKERTVEMVIAAEQYKLNYPPEPEMTCFKMQYGRKTERIEEGWMSLCDPILGFDYIEGYEYELLVKEIPIKNPPMDAPCAKYQLIKVISQTPVNVTPKP